MSVETRRQSMRWWRDLDSEQRIVAKDRFVELQKRRHETLSGREIQDLYENQLGINNLDSMQVQLVDGNSLHLIFQKDRASGVSFLKEFDGEKHLQWHIFNATPLEAVEFAEEKGWRVPFAIKQLVISLQGCKNCGLTKYQITNEQGIHCERCDD